MLDFDWSSKVETHFETLKDTDGFKQKLLLPCVEFNQLNPRHLGKHLFLWFHSKVCFIVGERKNSQLKRKNKKLAVDKTPEEWIWERMMSSIVFQLSHMKNGKKWICS